MVWQAYRVDMRIKAIDSGKHGRINFSYLANTGRSLFLNTQFSFFLTR